MNPSTDASQTVLILAPMANDAKLAAKVLESSGILAAACADEKELCERMQQGCGAVVISEEALTRDTIELLRSVLDNQETWSDIPILLLTNADVVTATEIFSRSGNISLLERPFSRLTLIRSVEVALRARLKQYEVRELLRALQKSKDQAERANTAKTEFLANMSHEIRTPIGAIMGFIELLKNSDPDEQENATYMGIIDRNSKQLLSLIDDILDLSKVEAGKMTLENLEVDLREFLAEFNSTMNLKASEKSLNFRLASSGRIPDRIVTDPVRLRQVLSNVVGNAIKFTDRGSVTLTTSYNAPFLNFHVTDTGIGLSSQAAKKIFSPFTQADSSTTRKFGGTGLGLALSRSLAENLGGGLHLENSEPNRGSTFAIQIKPALTADTHLIDAENLRLSSVQKENGESEEILKDLKVLVVEDSPDNQYLIETYLKKTGAIIDICSNGAEGYDQALRGAYDVVLMDVQMPVMDGHEAVRRLRNIHYVKPIVALTAHAMSDEKERCLASGFNEYLTKPLSKTSLVESLKKYVPVGDTTLTSQERSVVR